MGCTLPKIHKEKFMIGAQMASKHMTRAEKAVIRLAMASRDKHGWIFDGALVCKARMLEKLENACARLDAERKKK